MKTLVISDIHTKHHKAQEIIDRNPSDYIIFLGDYFDAFEDCPEDNARTAQWLKQYLYDGRATCLLGNHDMYYYHNKRNPYVLCSGFSDKKNHAINSALNKNDWEQFKPFKIIDNILLTHAGLSQQCADLCLNIEKPLILNRLAISLSHAWEDAKTVYLRGGDSWMFRCGMSSGHPKWMFPAFMWCRDREFQPIEGIRQIFGHTPAKEVRQLFPGQICLDTNLRHAIMIEDGEIRIIKNDKH